MNKIGIEKYPEPLIMSDALTTEMQNKGATYLNIKDDNEYKSLYGEKNPQSQNQSNREKYLHLLHGYKRKLHVFRRSSSSTRLPGGLRLQQRAEAKHL